MEISTLSLITPPKNCPTHLMDSAMNIKRINMGEVVEALSSAVLRSLSSIMMQQVTFDTSMKNIPLGGNNEFVMQFTKSIRKVVYAME